MLKSSFALAGSGGRQAGLRDDVHVHVQAAAGLLRHRHPEGVQVPQRGAGGGRVICTIIGLFIQLPTQHNIK